MFEVRIQYLGLVNYVSDPGSTAFDRALVLAQSIAKNGVSLSEGSKV